MIPDEANVVPIWEFISSTFLVRKLPPYRETPKKRKVNSIRSRPYPTQQLLPCPCGSEHSSSIPHSPDEALENLYLLHHFYTSLIAVIIVIIIIFTPAFMTFFHSAAAELRRTAVDGGEIYRHTLHSSVAYLTRS
jgi:hypothetical protein